MAGQPLSVQPEPRTGAHGNEDCAGLRRILLIQVRNMGDVLLCTPAARELRKACPEAQIDFLTGRLGSDALRGNPHLDEVLVWPGGRGEQWTLIRELRRRRYDAVLDFQSHPRTVWIARATGARRRVGIRKRGPRNLAYTHLVPRETGAVYMARQKLALLPAIGIPVDAQADPTVVVAIGAAERQRAQEIWTQHGLTDRRPVVAISAVCREPYKQWGAERWAEVAGELASAGASILLSSGPGEREQVEAVVKHMRHPAVWDYGPTSIPELAAIYERCALWVGNDGGPKFVAAAAGTPTVTVFRWTQGDAWTDFGSDVPHLLLDREPPQGCDLRCSRCSHRGCLSAIPPNEVTRAALAALRDATGRHRALRSLPVLPQATVGQG